MLLDPAFTTNSSFPSAVRLIEPDESTIGKPNGGSLAIPLPPVETVADCVSLPSDPRLNTITWLPAGLLVAVKTHPAGALAAFAAGLEAASATHGTSNAAATTNMASSR